MLVFVETLHCEVGFKAELVKVAQHRWLNRNFVLTNNEALRFVHRRVRTFVPLVLLDLLRGQTLLRICFHHLAQHVLALSRQVFGHLELSRQNLLVKLAGIFVFKRQKAREHRKQDHSRGPHINATPVVQLALDHLGSGVAWRSTSSLESLSLLVGVGQAKVNQLQILLVVEQEIFRLQISVHNAQLVQVLDRALDLLEEFASLFFLKLLLFDDVVEQLAPRYVLHDQEELLRRLDDFK